MLIWFLLRRDELNNRRNNPSQVQQKENFITRFFEKMQLGELVEDQDGKYAFIFDDDIHIELSFDDRNIHMECLLCDLPIKMMTKDRLLADLAKNSVIDMRNNILSIYIDAEKKTVNTYRRIAIHKTNDAVFEAELGKFIDLSESYKKLAEKIVRMGELSDIPVEFRLEQ
jgi:hypothetical protein